MIVERVLDIARERLATIGEDASLREAARLLSGTHISLAVACNAAGAMTGIVTKSDIVRRIGTCRGNDCAATVSSVMTRDVTSCRPEDSLHDVLSLMKEHGFVHVPVTDENFHPLGVINARDALKVLLEHVQHEESLLRDYVMGIGYR